LLSKREVFQHELGAAATHRPDSTSTKKDDEDEKRLNIGAGFARFVALSQL
jgi:hypothetical protein